MNDRAHTFEVARDDLAITRLVDEFRPVPAAGEAVLAIDRFGLTANNITYGVAADLVGYWDFFPAEPGWGRLPVWGFADVVDGDVDGLPIGTRVFGYLPMSTHLVVRPERVSPNGFTDGATHRAHLPGVYNSYRRTDADPMHRSDTEDLQAVFWPLFATSFMLDDYLADRYGDTVGRIVLSSASSKTSAGTALCIRRRAGDGPEVVGLTSAGHVGFVEGLGVYDRVVGYDDVDSLDPSTITAFVDVAGNAAVRAAVHDRVGASLIASITVGMTHWSAVGADSGLPGPAPQMFFAPSQIEKRMTDWGPAGYQQRLGAAWAGLIDVVGDWVHLVEVGGLDEVVGPYDELLAGRMDPSEALVVDLHPR